jgi:hypothetical protein
MKPTSNPFPPLLLTFTLGAATAYPNAIEFLIAQPPELSAAIQAQPLTDNTYQLQATVEGGTPSYSYIWTPATGLSSATIANPVLSASSTEVYSLRVVDGKACSASAEYTLPLPLAIKENATNASRLKVYLGNGSSSISVYFPDKAPYAYLTLYSTTGQLLKTIRQEHIQEGDIRQWPVEDLPTGIYLIHIKTSTYQQTEKIIIP